MTEPSNPVLLIDPSSRREDTDSVSFQTHWLDSGARTFAVTSLNALPGVLEIEHRPRGRNLLDGMAHADLVVLAHPKLRPATDRLVEHRQRQGLDAVVVTTNEVYATFSHGFPTPTAIRSLTVAAMLGWPRPAPSFLLLVGDASNDPLDRLGYGVDNLVPTFVESANAYPSDSWFGLVSGDDPITDLQVGRLAASAVETVTLVTDKIIGYEGNQAIVRGKNAFCSSPMTTHVASTSTRLKPPPAVSRNSVLIRWTPPRRGRVPP